MTTATYPARRNDLALVWHQVRYEQLSFWRNPQAVFFTFVFPVVIIVIFGALFRGAGGSSYFYGLSALQRYGAALEPYASGVYVNDLTDEGEDGVRRAYGAAQIARLTALKGRYDPHNIFHLNHNIPAGQPASGNGRGNTRCRRGVEPGPFGIKSRVGPMTGKRRTRLYR